MNDNTSPAFPDPRNAIQIMDDAIAFINERIRTRCYTGIIDCSSATVLGADIATMSAFTPGEFWDHVNTLPIDVVHPDQHTPAHVGDQVPEHPFFAPMPEPLGPVLRPDSPARSRRWASTPPAAAPRAHQPRLHRIWVLYHEWITAGLIIFVALVACFTQN